MWFDLVKTRMAKPLLILKKWIKIGKSYYLSQVYEIRTQNLVIVKLEKSTKKQNWEVTLRVDQIKSVFAKFSLDLIQDFISDILEKFLFT